MSPLGAWQTFAVISGGASGALTGLLFVAVSIRVDVIAASTALTNRAAQTLVLFVTVLFVALFLAMPDQTYEALGGELLSLVAVFGAILVFLDRRARSDEAGPTDARGLATLLDAIAPNTITLVLLAAAGLLLVLGLHAGLYVLVSPVVVALAGGLVSAWLLLVRLPARPESDASRGP